MHVVVHIIGGKRRLDRVLQFVASFADVEIDVTRRFVQAVEMIIEKWDVAFIEPEPLPDTITQHEAAVVDRDLGIISMDDLTVDIDHDVVVARILLGFVGGDVVG